MNIKVSNAAQSIAMRMTDGGKEKIYVKDVTLMRRGWLDWQELAELIEEELREEGAL